MSTNKMAVHFPLTKLALAVHLCLKYSNFFLIRALTVSGLGLSTPWFENDFGKLEKIMLLARNIW